MLKSSSFGIHPAVQFLVTLVAVVAILYFGRPVLLPIGMAALGAFLLTPFIKFLERRGLPRVFAVITAALGALGLLAAFSWLIASQLNGMSAQLPQYRDNLIAKLDGLKFTSGTIDNLSQVLNDVSEKIDSPSDGFAIGVRVVEPATGTFDRLQTFVVTLLEPIANIGVVLVLMVFVLIHREDLRNRVVRLSGKRFALTTRTLDDLGMRISRYLVANALVNGAYGTVVALGLTIIGIDYAVMWGALAAVLRFIPYVGPAVGMFLPMTMAFIQFPGNNWSPLIYTAAFFAVLETTTNVVIEPLTYGYSIGVSIVALLISAIFWSWIWGPMGLFLSVPITVTLAVLGEYVPALESLAILLGDKPALEPHVVYYQRLLAGDVEEAESVLEKEVQTVGLLDAYDNVALPAVIMAERDLQAGELTTVEHDAVVQATREFMDEVTAVMAPIRDRSLDNEQTGVRARIIGCPVRDLGDEMVLEMLKQSLGEDPSGELTILSSAMLASEMVAALRERQPDAVCVSSLGPLGRRQTRYLCKRIRQDNPHIRIIVGNWGYRRKDTDKMTASLKQCGADVVFTTLSAAREYFEALTPRILTNAAPPETRPDPIAPDSDAPSAESPVAASAATGV